MFNIFQNDEIKLFLDEHFYDFWNIYIEIFQKYPIETPQFITSFYESLNSFISHLPNKSERKSEIILRYILDYIINLKSSLKSNLNIELTFCCSVISTILTNNKFLVEEYCSSIMNIIQPLFSIHDYDLYSEILIILNIFVLVLKYKFQEYYQYIIDPLYEVYLSNNYYVISICSQLISDLYLYPNYILNDFTDKFYQINLSLLKDSYLPKYYKPYILNSLISLSGQVKHDYQILFNELFLIILNIQNEKIDITDESERDYLYRIFESILKAYVFCIQIYSDKEYILRNIQQIFKSIELMTKYSTFNKKSLYYFTKLIYLLVQTCGYSFCKLLKDKPFIYDLFNIIMQSNDQTLINNSEKILNNITLYEKRKF